MNKLMDRLQQLRKEGLIRDIDLELCRFLQRQHRDISDNVLLAGCLSSYLYGQGDVCMSLQEYAGKPLFDESSLSIKAPGLTLWRRQLEESSVVGAPGEFKPMILDEGGRLYLHKLWHYESSLAEALMLRGGRISENINVDLLRDGLRRLFPGEPGQQSDWQRVAAAASVRNKLSIISGGPGTGKTSTVVRVLALLLEQATHADERLSIALAAPTGKAAARLKDSILTALDTLAVTDEIREMIPEQAMTLHQLLGARRHTSSFKYHEENPVPYNVIILDEASMVDQALMSKLLSALLTNARLILLGDKDQLASVEAGSVLGDICAVNTNMYSKEMARWLGTLSLPVSADNVSDQPGALTDNITLLTKSYRFDERSGIGRLAKAINRGKADQAIKVLTSPDFEDTVFHEVTEKQTLQAAVMQKVTTYFSSILQSDSTTRALQIFNDFRILAAHRKGPWGVEYLNRLVENILQQENLVSKYARWYPGKPVIVTVNDYALGLHNGDTGVCLPDKEGRLKVFFPHEDSLRAVAPARLPEHNPAFALTVHKSQGSEFKEILLILPDAPSKVLSRELIYTAVTRARTAISIVGSKNVLNSGINKKLHRASGLKNRLWST